MVPDEKLLPSQRNAATASKKTTSKIVTSNNDALLRQETNKENLQDVEVQDLGLGLGKSAQHKLLLYSGYSPEWY